MTPAVIAHRGGALLWPENSWAAIEGALALGVEQLQIDVHPSRDGQVVVIHDATVDRTTDGRGPVAERSWAALAGLTLAGTDDQRLPRLDEVARRLAGSATRLRLEIKADAARQPYPGLPGLVDGTLAAARLLDSAIISGFDPVTLAEFGPAEQRPRVWMLSTDWLTAHGLDGALDLARRHRFPALAMRGSALDAGIAAAIRGAGLGLEAFGCSDEGAIAAAIALGVDAVSSDRPDLALTIRRRAAG